MAATVFWYGPRVILASLGARELQIAEAPALHSTAERLALIARVERPRLYLLADGHPRALSVGRGAGASGIALTRGLMTLLQPGRAGRRPRATSLAHARQRDSLVQTPVVLIAGLLVEASRIGGFLSRAPSSCSARSPPASSRSSSRPSVSLPPTFARPRSAARLHPLADALVRIEQAEELVSFRASPVTELAHTSSTPRAGWARRPCSRPTRPSGRRRAPARPRPRGGGTSCARL